LKLVLADLYELLDRSDLDLAPTDLCGVLNGVSDGLVFDALEEALRDRELYIRFKQREANVPKGRLDIIGRDLGNASKAIFGGSKAFRKGLKHGGPG
ncbi:MAG: hypothetical protein ACI9KE_006660, partial [Polyangiales bacterium]